MKEKHIMFWQNLHTFIDVWGVPDQYKKGSWHKTDCLMYAPICYWKSSAPSSGRFRRRRRLGLRLLEPEKKFLLQNVWQWICMFIYETKKHLIIFFLYIFIWSSIFKQIKQMFSIEKNAYEMFKQNLNMFLDLRGSCNQSIKLSGKKTDDCNLVSDFCQHS